MANLVEVMKKSLPLKLLFVEDNEGSRESILEIFEDIFGEVIIGVDGQDGLEKFKQNDIDIVITDISMPILNGIEMTKKIKSINSDIPVILLSAHNESGYTIEDIDISIDGFIHKPIKMDNLLKILDRVIV